MNDYAGTFVLVLLTTLIGIGCYGAATHGAVRRTAVDTVRHQLVAEARIIRGLEVELRTRARLPQLERWNEQVLKMSAPAASQFMASPVQLINLVTPPAPMAPAEPQLRFALAPAEPEGPGKIVQARFALDEPQAGVAMGAKAGAGAGAAAGVSGSGIVRASFPAAGLSRDVQTSIDASLEQSLGQQSGARQSSGRQSVGEP